MQTAMRNNFSPNGLVAMALLTLIVLAASGCDRLLFGACKNTITFGAISPDGRYVATVYQRACGAPTGVATRVEIQSLSTKFKGQPKDSIFAFAGPIPVGVVWIDNSSLRVECIRCAPDKIFKQEKAWKDVTISYESYGDIGAEHR
jgi:hypothetical protein